MNATRVTAAEGVVFAAMQTRQTARGIAAALEAACMLQSPESAAEMRALRAEVSELRKQVAELSTRPVIDDVAAWLVKKAREYRGVPSRVESASDALARMADKVSRGAIRPALPIAGAPCCEFHRPAGCCDPEDCGPCCEACPTCPTLTRRKAGSELKAGVLAEQRHWIDEDDTTFQTMTEATS